MAKNDSLYKNIIDNLYDGVYFVDPDRIITYWNRGAQRITGYSAEDVIGRSCRQTLLNHVSATGEELCEGKCPLVACMEDGTPREAAVFAHHADGHRIPVSVRVSPLFDAEGRIMGAVESFSSTKGLFSLKQELRRLRRSARTDSLTGVGNRRYLEDRLRATLVEIQRQSDPSTGLLFIDIDRFKPVNDTWGHPVGDKVLAMVASSIRHCLRQTDTVGRWGGEEFLVILQDVFNQKELAGVAEKVRVAIESSRLDLDDWSLTVTASLGATLLSPSDTPEDAVKRADHLMYESKSNGRNLVTVG